MVNRNQKIEQHTKAGKVVRQQPSVNCHCINWFIALPILTFYVLASLLLVFSMATLVPCASYYLKLFLSF